VRIGASTVRKFGNFTKFYRRLNRNLLNIKPHFVYKSILITLIIKLTQKAECISKRMFLFMECMVLLMFCSELMLKVQGVATKKTKEQNIVKQNDGKPLPDLNLPVQKSDYLYNSNDAKARRIGKRLFKKGTYSTLDEAIDKTKEMILERRQRWNKQYKNKQKQLRNKPKDYHKPKYSSQSQCVERMAKKILNDKKNDINDAEIAHQTAQKFIREKYRYYYHRRAKNKSQNEPKAQ
jgi:hypothetical protein